MGSLSTDGTSEGRWESVMCLRGREVSVVNKTRC